MYLQSAFFSAHFVLSICRASQRTGSGRTSLGSGAYVSRKYDFSTTLHVPYRRWFDKISITYFDAQMFSQLIKVHLRIFLTVEVHSIARLGAVDTAESAATLMNQFGFHSLFRLGLQLLIKFLQSLESLVHLDVRGRCRVLHVFHLVLSRCESTEILLVIQVSATTCRRVFSRKSKRLLMLGESGCICIRVSASV